VHFQLEAFREKNEWRYQFSCETPVVPIKKECHPLTTEEKTGEKFFIDELMQQQLKCPKDEFLTSFVLQTNLTTWPWIFWYSYSCCK